MKHVFLTTALALGTLGLATGQTARPVAARTTSHKPATPAAAPATPAPEATPTDEENPKYGGIYINGKQVTEINCYGVDEYTIVYPFFNSLDICNHFYVVVRAGSYDTKGKFNLEYSEFTGYDQGSVDAVREKFAGKGYGTITRTGLLEKYNAHRTARADYGYEVSPDLPNNPAFNVLKYTEYDAAKVTKSVMYVEVYTYNHSGRYTDQGNPIYKNAKIYRSPDILLKDRVSTGAAGLKASGAKKGLSFVPIVGAVTLAMKDKEAPEMTNENCVPVGPAVPLSTVKKVTRDNVGEEISTE